jgi:hypothetical protein
MELGAGASCLKDERISKNIYFISVYFFAPGGWLDWLDWLLAASGWLNCKCKPRKTSGWQLAELRALTTRS